MIPGVVASQALGSDAPAPASPTLADIDFVTGTYTINGTVKSVSEVISRPDLVQAQGLFLQGATVGGYVRAIGPFADVLALVNWTLVIEFHETDTGQMLPLEFYGGSALNEHFYIESNDLNVGVYDQPDPGADREIAPISAAARPATRKLAITRTDAKLVVSLNGGAAQSETIASQHSDLDDFFLGGQAGGFAFMDGFIHFITVYEPQADADLPALSTV